MMQAGAEPIDLELEPIEVGLELVEDTLDAGENVPDDTEVADPEPATDQNEIPDAVEVPAPTRQVEILVSSKHLTLTSKVFKSMMKNCFKEGSELREQGSARLPLPDDSLDALLILLNLMHGKVKEVPREIGLSVLIAVAVLVDKYELIEITDLVADRWIASAVDTALQQFDNLLPWPCILWVFRKSEIFGRMTGIGQLESKSLIEGYGLPLPQSIMSTSSCQIDEYLLTMAGNIEECRESTLRDILGFLHDTIARYKGPDRICQSGLECDSMVLGALIIGLGPINRLLGAPASSYEGRCVKWMLDKLKGLRIPTYCGQNFYSGTNCGKMPDALEKKIQGLESKITGFDLEGRPGGTPITEAEGTRSGKKGKKSKAAGLPRSGRF